MGTVRERGRKSSESNASGLWGPLPNIESLKCFCI